MVFRDRAGYSFKVRVVGSDGSSIRASTGCVDESAAKNVAAFIHHLRHTRTWAPLDAIVARKITLRQAYDAYLRKGLDELLEDVEQPDLDRLVSEWGKQAEHRYVRQVRRLIPEGERFPLSAFRRAKISAFLATLPVSGSTRNRYRSALSVFAKWLVEREFIETNPVRDVRAAKGNPARMVYLNRQQAQALVNALPEPFRALEALMAGTGMEWQAIMQLRRWDVDLSTRKIHAKGRKTVHRERIVRVTEDWTWPIIEAHVKTRLPGAPLFKLDPKAALNAHYAASEALDLPRTTLHDWRHTYAVQALRDGMRPAAVKRQLGHAVNSVLLERVYGVYIPEDADYDIPERQAR